MKIIDCIGLLTPKERGIFREQLVVSSLKFLPNIIALYDILQDCMESGLCAEVNKGRIWNDVYPDKEFNDRDWRWLCSKLTTQIEFFLVRTAYNEPLMLEKLKIKAFYKRKAIKYALQEELVLEKMLEAIPKGSEYYSSLYFHKLQHINYAVERDNREYAPDLEVLNKLLDVFYLIEKMKHYCDALNRQTIVHKNYDLSNVKIIEHIISSTPEYLEQPTVKAYYSVIQLLSNYHYNHTEIFQNLKKQLFEGYYLFDQNDKREFLTHLQNYCIRVINQGFIHYRIELFELYEWGIEQRDLFQNSILPSSTYKNILTLGILLEKYQWLEDFLKNYTRFLLPNIQANALQYNSARLYFAQKKYDKVIWELQTIIYDEIFYALDSRCLLIKTYYELKEWELLEGTLLSFRVFLFREKEISEKNKKPYQKFIRYVLFLLKNQKKRRKITELLKILENDNYVAERKWLIEKVTI